MSLPRDPPGRWASSAEESLESSAPTVKKRLVSTHAYELGIDVSYSLLRPTGRRTDPRRYWHIINDDRRGDSRGEWRERPRLLAGLSATAIERQANDVHQRWRRKWDHKAAAKGIHT